MGQLVARLGDGVASLIQEEFALAKRETAESLDGLRRAAGLLLGAAVLALPALFLLASAVADGLSRYVQHWQAALGLGMTLVLAAGLMARAGLRRFRIVQLKPRQALETIQEATQWLKDK